MVKDKYKAEDWNKWVTLCKEAKRFEMDLVPIKQRSDKKDYANFCNRCDVNPKMEGRGVCESCDTTSEKEDGHSLDYETMMENEEEYLKNSEKE